MREELLNKLKIVTEEEQKILDGNKNIIKSRYTEEKKFIVDSKKMLKNNQLIAVRTHTRFTDFPNHSHNFIEMMYVCEGEINHIIDGKRIQLKKGEILLLNQHSWHSIKKAGMNDIAINLIILPEFFDNIYPIIKYDNFIADFLINILKNQRKKGEYLLFKVSEVLEIQNLMENIIYSLTSEKDSFILENQVTISLLFLYLTRHVNKVQKVAVKEFEELLIDSVLEYIDKKYRVASLTEISKILNQTDYSLSKLIKRKTNHNFKELLQKKRFERAEELLKETKLPINDIISTVGYENNSYFFKKFKELYNITPAYYRKNKN